MRRLRRIGHAVDWQHDGLSADGVLAYEAFDTVITDIGLPRLSSFEVLQRLRERGSKTVLALTARVDIEDRVRARHRRRRLPRQTLRFPRTRRAAAPCCAGPARRPPACSASASWSSTARRAGAAGGAAHGPAKREYSLLEILLARLNGTVSKREIAFKLFAFDDDAAPNAIEVYIARLRRKLEGSPLRIETQRGVGYPPQRARGRCRRQPGARVMPAAGAAPPVPRRTGLSVRRRLLAMLLALFALGLGALCTMVRGYAYQTASITYDQLLTASVLSITDSLQYGQHGWQLDMPYAALALLEQAPRDRVFYRVSARQQPGHRLCGPAAPPRAPTSEAARTPQLFDAVYRGSRCASPGWSGTWPAPKAPPWRGSVSGRRARRTMRWPGASCGTARWRWSPSPPPRSGWPTGTAPLAGADPAHRGRTVGAHGVRPAPHRGAGARGTG